MNPSIPRFVLPLALVLFLVLPGWSSWSAVPLKSGNAMATSVAVGDSVIAVGLSEGGVRWVTRSRREVFPLRGAEFGPRQRVYDLAWLSRRLVVASEGGVHFVDGPTDAPVALDRAGSPMGRGGVRVLLVRGNELWMGGPKGIAVLEGAGAGRLRTWKLPDETDQPQCLLVVGSTVLVGTAASGLLILDVPTGTWSRIGRDEGLPENQITGLELVGARIFAGTSRGLAVIELSSRATSVAVAGMVSGWMTQINGALVVSTFDGLVRVDGASLAASRLPVDQGLEPEGALGFDRGVLASGGKGGRLLLQDLPTLLGSEPLQVVAEGLRLRLSSALPSGATLSAQLRMPEWPAAAVPVAIEAAKSPSERILRFPNGAGGRFILEVALHKGNTLLERRSLEVVADRSPPLLALEAVPGWSKDSVLELRGRSSAASGVSLYRDGRPQALDVDDDGRFKDVVGLARGLNLIRFRAVDGAGNASEREVGIVRDDQAPWLQEPPVDTVDGSQIQLRLVLREPNLKLARIEPEELASMIVSDSFVLVDLRDLAPGRNLFRIELRDMAGNATERTMVVVRRGEKPPVRLVDPDPIAATKSKNVNTDSCACPVAASATTPVRSASAPAAGVFVVRYGMREGETLRRVAERFYGDRELASVLIRWNGLNDSTQWRRMPIGTVVDVPFWKDIEHGRFSPEEAMATLPRREIP
jgi:hypothetical protein